MMNALLSASWGFIISILNQTVKRIIWINRFRNFSFYTDVLTYTLYCGPKDIFIINTPSADQLINVITTSFVQQKTHGYCYFFVQWLMHCWKAVSAIFARKPLIIIFVSRVGGSEIFNKKNLVPAKKTP